MQSEHATLLAPLYADGREGMPASSRALNGRSFSLFRLMSLRKLRLVGCLPQPFQSYKVLNTA